MEGKTDSKISAEMVLQGAETSIESVDRVSTACWSVIGEHSSAAP